MLQRGKGPLLVEETFEICTGILCLVLAIFWETTKLYRITMGLDELLGWKDLFEFFVRKGLS